MNKRRKPLESAVALMLLATAEEQQSPLMFANPKKNRRNKVKRAHK